MPLSAVIHLQATADARLDQFTGRGVHGFWFRHWRQVDPELGARLHEAVQDGEFTLSPLLGLPRPGRGGDLELHAGQSAWFRLATLSDALTEAVQDKWLGKLQIGQRIEIPGERIEGERIIPGLGWRVTAIARQPGEHPFAAQVDYQALARRLIGPNPPRGWKLEFLTPTTFHGKAAHLPFPLPESLINSWLRRWQAFAPLALPEDELLAWGRGNLAVSAYRLHTLPAREGERLRVGCVGTLSLRALDMPPYLRAAVDTLAAFAFFCGSGAHTAQGLGQTRCLEASVH